MHLQNNDFTVQTISEMYVQCDPHSDPRHTANDVSIIRCCDQYGAPWQCAYAPLHCDRLLQLINDVQLIAGLLGHMSGSMQTTFSRRDSVSRNVRWRTVLMQSPAVAPSSVL